MDRMHTDRMHTDRMHMEPTRTGGQGCALR
jgi:hypothetical protein